MQPRFTAKLLLGAATAALLLATGACSSNGSGQGLSFAASAPQRSGGDGGQMAAGGTQSAGGDTRMDSTPGGVADVAVNGGGGGGGSGGTCNAACAPGNPADPGGVRRYATYNERETGVLSRLVDDANMLVSMGNADLGAGVLDPLAAPVAGLDRQLSAVGKVVLSDSALVGSSRSDASQLIGVSALSNGAPSGDLIGLGLLNADGAATLSLAGAAIIPGGALPAVPAGQINGALQQVASVGLGNSTLIGAQGVTPVIGLGLGGSSPATGTLASVNLAPDGALGVAVGGNPLVGVNAGGAAPVTGNLATVGVLQDGGLLSVQSPLLSGLGLGGVTDTLNQALGSSVPTTTPNAPTGGLGGLGGLLGL